jgi:hypothetical protein
MIGGKMDKIEKAREMFEDLEMKSSDCAADVARRNLYLIETLSER